MIHKIPRWAWYGGAFLALISGSINAVGFLGFQHQGVTHLTGTATLIGISAARGDLANGLRLIVIVLSFILGCVLSGILIQDSTLRLGRRYGLALCCESLMLFLAVPLLNRGSGIGNCLASCAIGLQNGMATAYSGTALRTSHLSGMFTDLGISIGHWVRGMEVNQLRLSVCVLIISAFTLGAGFGSLGFARFGYEMLYIPAFLTGGVGFAYGVYRHFVRNPAEPHGPHQS